jgi:hypothetical protein
VALVPDFISGRRQSGEDFPMKYLFRLLVLLALATPAAPVRAETWVGDSLEWMTDDSALILRGTVLKSARVAAPGATGFLDLSVQVQEVLKGKYASRTITIRSWPGEAREGNACLFFLKKGPDIYGADDYRQPIVGNHWTQRVFWNGNPYGAIDLQKPGAGRGVVTAAFKVLTKPEPIVAAVRARIKFTKQNPPVIKPAQKDGRTGFPLPPLGVIWLEAPFDSEAHHTFYGGSAVYVYVPADRAMRPKILQMLKEHRSPERVAALANYPGQDTEQLLRNYLNDPTTSEVFTGGRVVEIQYPVRAAAYGALLRLGMAVPQPVLSKRPGK